MRELIIFIFLTTSYCTYSQNQFNSFIDNEYDVIPHDLVEYNNSYFILSTVTNETTNIISSLIYKLNTDGSVCDSLIISSDELSYDLHNIAIFNDNLILTGFTKALNDFNICIIELSANLEIEEQFLYPYNLYYYLNCCISTDKDYIYLAAGINTSSLDMLFIKFNNRYEIEKDTIIDTSSGDIPYDIISNKDQVLISVRGEELKRIQDQIWKLHDDLSVSFVADFNGINFSTIVFDSEDKLLTCGEKYRYVNGEIEDYITNYRYIEGIGFTDSISIGIDLKRDHISRFKSIAATDNRIFILFSRNIDMGIIDWFVPNKVNACLFTLDYAFNIINETVLEDEICYNTCNLKTTSDNGCIFLSSRYDFQTGVQERDLVVVKTDPNGVFTWTTEIPLPDLPNSIYPNPASDCIHIKDQFIPGTLQIFNVNGKQFLETATKNTVDISNLGSGNYVYRIVNKNGIISSAGKMIVE